MDGETLYFLHPDDRVKPIASVPAKGGTVETLYPSAHQPGVVWYYDVGPNGVIAVTTFPHAPPEALVEKWVQFELFG